MLAKYHVKQGHEVVVIASLFTFDEKGAGVFLPGPSERQDINGFKVLRLAYKRPMLWNRIFRHYQGLYEAIEIESPDIIFSHGVSFGDSSVLCKYLKKHPGVVLYADNHADYVNSAKNWLSRHVLHPIIWRRSAKLLEPFMAKCWGVTPLRCQFLKEMYHINPDIIGYLPMGVDDEAIPIDRNHVRSCVRNDLCINSEDVLLFTGGKIDRLKNTHILIDALQILNDSRLHLVICGVLTSEMEFIKNKIDSNPRIHYLGWCDAEKVMNCMIAADFACFPGTHSTLWEQSVGVGLPIICKQWHGMEHISVNGNCRFVKGEDVEDLRESLKEWADPSTLQELRILANEASELFLYSNISVKAIGL